MKSLISLHHVYGLIAVSLAIAGCTKNPEAASATAESIQSGSPTFQPTLNDPQKGSLSADELKEITGYNETRKLHVRIVQKRKTYTFDEQNDVPIDRNVDNVKREIKQVYKSIVSFVGMTGQWVEKYARTPYVDVSQRASTLKNSRDPDQTENVVTSVLKDFFGTQSPTVDFSSVESKLCNGDQDWPAYLVSLKSALEVHAESLKVEKAQLKAGKPKRDTKRELKRIRKLLDHSIWNMIKYIENPESDEAIALLYLKKNHCGSAAVAAPVQQQNTAPVETLTEASDQSVDVNSIETTEQMLYYTADELQALPQPDLQAPNVGVVEPTQE